MSITFPGATIAVNPADARKAPRIAEAVDVKGSVMGRKVRAPVASKE
jgi:hypothetical protein